MREIKFRARLTKDGKPWMFYQDTQYLISFLRRCTSYIFFEKDGEEGKHESYLPKPLEDYLDEYTGLKDKNGKEIYEGDILESQAFIDTFEWIDGAYSLCRDMGSRPITTHYPYEVIGNIYENPELLK